MGQGAQRVSRPSKQQSSTLSTPELESKVGAATTEAEVVAAFCPSLSELSDMANNELWATRQSAFKAINARLEMANAEESQGDSLAPGLLDGYLDLALHHLADTHHKVTAEALETVQRCVERHADTSIMQGKLGGVNCPVS